MLDGNRRWAKAAGADTAAGHRAGAANISPFLGWCDELGIEVVTLWLLSTDNLNRRAAELAPLLGIIEDVVTELAAEQRWRINPVGALDLLPDATARTLKEAAAATRDVEGVLVNVAVGYGGRREIADAVRSLLQHHAKEGTSIEELATILDVEHIAEPPLHEGPARPRPRHPHLGRAAARRLPALAVRAQRVLLLRGLLARLPSRRLPPGAAGVRRAQPSLRRLTGRLTADVPTRAGGPAGGRVCRASTDPGPTVGGSTERGSTVRREARS